MRLHPLAAAAALTLALAGCASSGGLQPDGSLTAPSSLKASRSLAELQVTPAAWPARDWWTGLGDAQLSQLIDEGLRNNPSLAMADARARAAQAEVGIADAARKPGLKAGAAYSGARLPSTVLPSSAGGGHFLQAKYADLSFNWSLDLWGGKRAAWEAALGQARASQIDAQATRIELSANVARAYVQLGYAFAQQDVANAEYKRAAEVRKLTAQRVAAGIDSQLQIKQDDSAVAQARGDQAAAAGSIASARSALAVLLGKGPDRGLDIGRPQPLQPAALAVPDDLPVGLIGHRADLVAARWRVEAAAKSIKAAKTAFLPNLSIGAFAGVLATGGHNLFELPARFYQFGPSLSLPIFDGGRLRANLAGKDAVYDEAVAQYNQTLVRAVNQVADDLAGLHALKLQVDAQQQQLAAASQAWQLARQRYRAGVGNYLEQLAARQQVLAAQAGMAGLQAQQADLSVQLIQALGGGYRPDAATEPPRSAPAGAGSATPSSSTSRS